MTTDLPELPEDMRWEVEYTTGTCSYIPLRYGEVTLKKRVGTVTRVPKKFETVVTRNFWGCKKETIEEVVAGPPENWDRWEHIASKEMCDREYLSSNNPQFDDEKAILKAEGYQLTYIDARGTGYILTRPHEFTKETVAGVAHEVWDKYCKDQEEKKRIATITGIYPPDKWKGEA